MLVEIIVIAVAAFIAAVCGAAYVSRNTRRQVFTDPDVITRLVAIENAVHLVITQNDELRAEIDRLASAPPELERSGATPRRPLIRDA